MFAKFFSVPNNSDKILEESELELIDENQL